MLGILVSVHSPSRTPTPGGARSGVVLQFYGAVAVGGFLLHALTQDSNDVWHVGDWSKASADAGPGSGWALLIGAAFGLAVVATFRILARWMPWIDELQDEFRSILGRLSEKEALMLAAASSLGEEILFRSALLDLMGIVASSLLFALVHLPPRRALLPWTLSAGLLGLALAQLTVYTGNIGAAVVAHFLINWLNLRLISRSA